MAFPWDDVQEHWLARKLGPLCQKFETKVPVSGAALEIDAVAEQPGQDPFFNFLSSLNILENKAPLERFNEQELFLLGARTLHLLRKRGLGLAALEEATQVVLCSQATAKLKRKLKLRKLREGISEGHFVARLVLVEANLLPTEPALLELLVHYASGPKLLDTISAAVEAERSDLYSFLWLLRRKPFQEILKMKKKAMDETTLSLRETLREIGIPRIIDEVGLDPILQAAGLDNIRAFLERTEQLKTPSPTPGKPKPKASSHSKKADKN